MPKKIMVIMGSPRVKGNTETLANAFIKEAKAKGHEVKSFHLGKIKVAGCLGCDKCFSTERPCIQKDGMDEIYQAFQWADTIILASPLYFWHLSSQIKAVIDRLQALGFKTDFKYPKKDVALFMVGASKKEEAFDAVQAYYNFGIVKYFGWNDLGTIFGRRLLHKGDIEGMPILDEARRFAAKL